LWVLCGQDGAVGAIIRPNIGQMDPPVTQSTAPEPIHKRRGFTEKREAFAQLVVALGNQTEAYKLTYSPPTMSDDAIRCEASRLLRVPYVFDRVRELRDGLLERANLQADDLVAMCIDTYEQAMEAKQYAAAKGAAELLAKITGIGADKIDITSGGQPITTITRRIVRGSGNTDA